MGGGESGAKAADSGGGDYAREEVLIDDVSGFEVGCYVGCCWMCADSIFLVKYLIGLVGCSSLLCSIIMA